ncbi:MAG: tRNA (adenosine(37)-N6)-threonylcarbamoyltransferase complex ATPase subunit type 1 TsaE [Chitinophagaceae bacterium]|nr:tRNA (adenosine(37)-N6)-threonylcarbamoyltransferase complex ATPase subunit type 1 TsaE [Chitinophagaceae bacterium]
MTIDYSLEKIGKAAAQFLEKANGYRVFAFSGQLGAGKTTFISALCKHLGVNEIVSSPTFAIVQQYDSARGNIFHLDLYRIKSEDEALNSGLGEAIDSGDICLIEWPENAPGLLPPDAIRVQIELTGNDTRKLNIRFPRA